MPAPSTLLNLREDESSLNWSWAIYPLPTTISLVILVHLQVSDGRIQAWIDADALRRFAGNAWPSLRLRRSTVWTTVPQRTRTVLAQPNQTTIRCDTRV